MADFDDVPRPLRNVCLEDYPDNNPVVIDSTAPWVFFDKPQGEELVTALFFSELNSEPLNQSDRLLYLRLGEIIPTCSKTQRTSSSYMQHYRVTNAYIYDTHISTGINDISRGLFVTFLRNMWENKVRLVMNSTLSWKEFQKAWGPDVVRLLAKLCVRHYEEA